MEKDYSTKIFQGKGLRDIVSSVEQVIDSNPSFNQEYKGTEKKDALSKLLEVDEVRGERILGFISYVDDMLISELEKIAYLLTFSSLLEDGKLNADALDDGYVFLLTGFFKSRTVEEMKQLISMISVPELIASVRTKTLDESVRMELLDYVAKQYQKQGIDQAHQTEFLTQMITNIQGLEYYKLMEIVHS